MANAGFHHGQSDQPGLEVVHNYTQYNIGHIGLEVKPGTGLEVNQPFLPPIVVPNGLQDKEVSLVGVKGNEGNEANEANAANALPRRWSVKRIVLIVLCCILVIIGAVVGGVVGTRQSQASTTTNANDQGSAAQSDVYTGPSPAAMTGSPTSVSVGLAPTAISWGYPHLEIFAMTNNVTQSVYRKYRNVNATSDTDFVPSGKDMELVGGGINFKDAPTIAVNYRITGQKMNRTELHINGENFAYNKWHEANQVWDNPGPNVWNVFQRVNVIGSPAEVKYDPEVEVMKVFYLAKGDNGINANFFQWHPQDNWTNLIPIPGPDLQPFTPAVVAWNRNDTRLDIFAVSRANSHLLHASWDSESTNWTSYEDLRGFVTSPPVAVSRTPGIIDVFARGGDGGLWHLSYDHDKNRSWTNWTRISKDMTIESQPDVISTRWDSIDVFAQGRNILHKHYDSTLKTWTPKDDFDEITTENRLAGPPKAVSDGVSGIHVFAYDTSNQLVWKTLGQSGIPIELANVPTVA
ncbi:fucose-specific lectin [Annulohypoxylon maeteangense]|uniref:fucose-specific lectin n=1 Tax=Annulohypoxylon maeteangense TaxID=1927788 RepID=UPI002008B14E|nr:fucose-specific lectin [Annulohypoxylon maeteangense]KAI0884178.1 fucose-specific lectin [Annulohypoxylon maeteangense]